MRTAYEPVKIIQITEYRVDIAIVRNIIAIVSHRRCEEWRQPDRIDTQIRNIVQFGDDPVQIANATIGRIQKAPRIDVVGHRPFPPCVFGTDYLFR